MALRHLLAGLGAAAALAAGPAAAAIVISFDYQGDATVGGVTSTLTTTEDTNNATRYFGPVEPSSQLIRDRASLINFADDDPFVFAAGGAAQGTASANARLTVKVDITNDTGIAQNFFWQGLIFAGGVGFAQPAYDGESCTPGAIESCANYFTPASAPTTGETAFLSFIASIGGVDLFSGEISVDTGGVASSFSNIALEGFGVTPDNAFFADWDPTNFFYNLGAFGIGETRTLEFTIVASTATLRSFCSGRADPDCLIAQAGFGDPPGSGSGGVSQNSGDPSHSVAFLLIAPQSALPEEIPLPPAALLFLAGGAGLGARRLKRG